MITQGNHTKNCVAGPRWVMREAGANLPDSSLLQPDRPSLLATDIQRYREGERTGVTRGERHLTAGLWLTHWGSVYLGLVDPTFDPFSSFDAPPSSEIPSLEEFVGACRNPTR